LQKRQVVQGAISVREGILGKDKDNAILNTYILEAGDLTKSRRECIQFINEYTKTCHQPGMPMKCLGMLLRNQVNGNQRVTKLDLDGKQIIHQIFLCQCGVPVKGTRNDYFGDRRGNRCHINVVSATGGTAKER
jgi:hypothetical protein